MSPVSLIKKSDFFQKSDFSKKFNLHVGAIPCGCPEYSDPK
jgi:hypothetical protein